MVGLAKEDVLVEKYIKKVEAGEIKPYLIEEEIFKESGDWISSCRLANKIRLKVVERLLNKRLEFIEKHNEPFCNPEKKTKQIELCVGCALVPLGVAGPLKISGKYAKGEIFIPLATNESALIGGLNRGIKAVNFSGGVRAFAKSSVMVRAPVVELPTIAEADELCVRIAGDQSLLNALRDEVSKESKYTKLLRIEPFQLNRYVWLRHVYETGEAMGMNSATKYTAIAIEKLKKEFPSLRLVALSGNLCTDKKSSHSNILLKRGVHVEAEVVLTQETLKNVFDTTVEEMLKVNTVKNLLGSALSGTFGGFNANAANTVAALFIATGQDSAQVVESSTCFTYAEAEKNGLRFCVSMPNIEVGSVGGGTGYYTSRECLEILNCTGEGGKAKLAEVVASAVLCQELNLVATLAKEYKLADSHIRLARGEAKNGK